MNLRQKQLLRILVDRNEYITVKKLSLEIDKSIRTVHNDIKVIQEFLEEFSLRIIKKPSVGIKIDATPSKKKCFTALY